MKQGLSIPTFILALLLNLLTIPSSKATDLTFGQIFSPVNGTTYKPGETINVSFEVKNINVLTAESYYCTATITPKSGGSPIFSSIQEAVNLLPGGTKTITMPQTWLTVVGDYSIDLKIFFGDDINLSNNNMSYNLTVAQCCLSKSLWRKGNAMTIVKNLSIFPAGEQLQRMRPGDLIAISSYVEDGDNLIQQCLCISGDDTLVSEKSFGPYADKVGYLWTLNGPGKLIEPDGNEDNTILYEIPLCDTNPVEIQCRVRNSAEGGKALDEDLLGTVSLRFNVGAKLAPDPSSDNEIGTARFFSVVPQIVPFSPKSNEIIEEIKQSECVAMPPVWLDLTPITQVLTIKEKNSDITCPDYMTLLSAEYGDMDSVITACTSNEGVQCPAVEPPKGEKQSDVVQYTWRLKSGKGMFPLGNQGASVVFLRSKSEDAEVECQIVDSKTQFTDKQTVTISAKTLRQRKPKAYIGVGNIAYEALWVNWGDNAQLLDAALIAQQWYEKAGYEVEFEPYATRLSATRVLENPCIQAFWIVGHGANESGRAGVIEMTDEKDFSPNDVSSASKRAFKCDVHPFVREAVLMGCYSARGRWGSKIFSARVHGFPGALINARWFFHEVLNWEKDKHFPPEAHDLRIP